MDRFASATTNPLCAWVIGLAPLLALDIWLIRTHRPSLSYHASRHPAVSGALTAYWCLHLISHRRRWQWDPLTLVGTRLAPTGNA